MRVLLVNAHGGDRTRGGAERYVRDLAAGLEQRGQIVELLSAFPIKDESADRTVSLHRHDWRDDRARRYMNHVGDWVAMPWPSFETHLQEIAPDLVHTHNLPGIGTGFWESARRLGIPVVHTLHDYHLLCPRTSLTKRDGSWCQPHPLLCGLRTRQLARWSRGVSTLVAVSEHVLRRHDRFFPRGTPTRVIRPPLRRVADLVPSPVGAQLRTLGYLGVLTQNKGVDLLLEAAPTLTRLGLSLRVAGNGPLEERVRSCADIDYVGWLEGRAVAEFLDDCDAGVVPSLWEEPGPLVVPEWLAAGRPVLATRFGGLAEATRRGGVASFDPTWASLVEVARRLREPAAWQELVASVPPPPGDDDLERWLTEHQSAYRLAVSAIGR